MSNDNTRLRKKGLFLRLLDEEYEILEDKCKKADMTKADYIRNLIFYGNPIVRDVMHDIDADKLIYELNRIGNNVNQIAYQANINTSVSMQDFLQLKDAYDEIFHLYIDHIHDRLRYN
jgi:hypothetical protein